MTLKKYLLDLFFPLECLACRAPNEWLCEKCFKQLKFNERKYFLNTPNLEKIFMAGDYDDKLLAQLIKRFKFHSLEPIGPILGRFLCSFWQEKKSADLNFLAPEKILVIPVPLSSKRFRWRGFNQAEIIARYFSDFFAYELNLNLKRIKHRRPQSALDEKNRAENIKDVFVWRGDAPANRLVILIDDVVTTGATLNEAARILKAAGAQEVYGLVLAKG